MKLQVWKISIVEGIIGAVHGHSYTIYEGYVPDLKLTINHVTSFVNEEDSKRYKSNTEEDDNRALPLNQHDPKLICEIELSRAQIGDMKALANEDGPYERSMALIASTLKECKLDTSDYEDCERDEGI